MCASSARSFMPGSPERGRTTRSRIARSASAALANLRGQGPHRDTIKNNLEWKCHTPKIFQNHRRYLSYPEQPHHHETTSTFKIWNARLLMRKKRPESSAACGPETDIAFMILITLLRMRTGSGCEKAP